MKCGWNILVDLSSPQSKVCNSLFCWWLVEYFQEPIWPSDFVSKAILMCLIRRCIERFVVRMLRESRWIYQQAWQRKFIPRSIVTDDRILDRLLAIWVLALRKHVDLRNKRRIDPKSSIICLDKRFIENSVCYFLLLENLCSWISKWFARSWNFIEASSLNRQAAAKQFYKLPIWIDWQHIGFFLSATARHVLFSMLKRRCFDSHHFPGPKSCTFWREFRHYLRDTSTKNWPYFKFVQILFPLNRKYTLVLSCSIRYFSTI